MPPAHSFFPEASTNKKHFAKITIFANNNSHLSRIILTNMLAKEYSFMGTAASNPDSTPVK